MKNKKASHVGVVLSFVIFITFLIFLYSVTEPAIKLQKDKEALLDYLEIELIKIFTSNLTTATITINSTWYVEDCVKLLNLTEEIEIDSRLIVKNKSGGIPSSNISEEDNTDVIIYRNDQDEVFFKIYNSEEFEELNQTTEFFCTELGRDEIGWGGHPNGYNVGLVRSETYLFEEKIIELIEDYNSNYTELKSSLNIPAGSEFGFGITYSNQTKKATEEKNISTNIYVKEIPIQYVNKEANINLGYMNIQIW